MPYVGCLVGTAFQKMTNQLDEALKAANINLSTPEYMILRALYSRDGLQQCEIGDMVGKDKAAVSRTVRSLAAKDFVRTETLSRKCCRVWLTEDGRSIETAVMRVAAARHSALQRLAPEEDIETFIRVLQTIITEN